MATAEVLARVRQSQSFIFNVNTMTWEAMSQPILNAGNVTVGGTVGVSNMIPAVETGLAKDIHLTDGTQVTTIPTGQGRTLQFIPIIQSGAGANQLIAGDTTRRIKVCGYVCVLSAAGTLKFTDGDGDLTGNMALAANSGVAAPGQASSPWFQTGINKALSIVTTGGAANGHLTCFLE